MTVNAGTGCAWTAVSTNSWLTIQSGASGTDTGLVTYVVAANTYLVAPGSKIATIAEVDRAGVRVVGISGTTTVRTAGRLLKTATVSDTPSVDDAMTMLRDGRADAFALVRDALRPLAAGLPGSRILDGSFHSLDIAVAVPKGRPLALGLVTAFMEEAKAAGVVRKALDAAGFQAEPVAGAAVK